MDNSIYIALSKQLVQFRKLEVHAQNMANAATPSYKQNAMMVTDWTINNGDRNGRQKISFAQDVSMYRNVQSGPLRGTGNNFDLAINGSGYFAVETINGTRYTRAGNFQLDVNGTLVTQDGNPVLTVDGGRIAIPQEARNFNVRENGTIVVDGEDFGQLNVVSFANEQRLERESSTLYKAMDAPIPAEEFQISQGFLEDSNVQPMVELSELITTQRRVSTTANFMDTAYELERRARDAWARTSA